MDTIDPVTLALVSKALDAATVRQAVHANNIANANTEGFAPGKVSFEEHLDQVRETLARNDRLAPTDLTGIEATLESMDAGRRVEVDSEVETMARNALHYQVLVKALSGELSLMSMAVSDGKR